MTFWTVVCYKDRDYFVMRMLLRQILFHIHVYVVLVKIRQSL